MNRNRYRLVRNAATGLWTPVAENARAHGKQGRQAMRAGLVASFALLAFVAEAGELPVACAGGACGTHPGVNVPFVHSGTASYATQGNTGTISQVGDKAIVNFRSFNLSPGSNVVYQQVDSLAALNPVAGASFTNLSRIWDANPSVIAGAIGQAAGQKANVILVNTNGIAFINGAQVNLNTFTASSLNMADTFVLDQFLTNSSTTPQFEGETGFIKVLEGAQITAGSQGRVMLLAPTVINQGKVSAPDGQVIAAAAGKVYLTSASNSDPNVRGLLIEIDSPAGMADYDTATSDVKDGVLDGSPVALTDPGQDKLGHVTNLGELAAARGNVTMVGLAVNQLGVTRATTSVVANGSVYLLAKDMVFTPPTLPNSTVQRGGRVLLGNGSVTEVLPEKSDSTGSLDGEAGAGLALASQVKVVGQDIRMAGGATIDAPAAMVELIAMDNPGLLDTTNDPFKREGASFISTTARVHVADGARINVAGLEAVEVDVARNVVKAELRGDELKDSPLNRNGPLRGKTVYVDINRAQANADAGKSTLIAQDSLDSYQARIERTVAERSTVGGKVSLRSQGEAILEAGAVVDLSGGSLRYTPGYVNVTQLSAAGVLTDAADASAEVAYDGIANVYTKDYGRWGVTESIALGQDVRYDAGYSEGKNAGALAVVGMRAAVVQADVQGRTLVGELQRDSGIQPAGATLTLGSNAVANDYKLNQQIEVSSTAAILPAGFAFGDTLTASLVDTLALNPAQLGKDKIANLEIFSNQAATVREAMRMPQGGSVAITAKGIAINADIDAAGGAITLNARGNNIDTRVTPISVGVADGVTLSARGNWVNELPGAAGGASEVALPNAGKITLSAVNDVDLGANTRVDVTGGGRIKTNGKITTGKGGEIKLEANAGSSAAGTHSGAVTLGGELRAYGLGKGGKLTLSTGKINIGGTPDATAGMLNLTADFFQQGGFADFILAGRDGLSVADGVEISPTVISLDLQPGYTLQATGAPVESFTSRVRRDDAIRQAANLSLSADATDLGDLRIGAGARISADPKAKITLNAGHRLEIQGQISAPGGSITATLNRAGADAFDAGSALWLGSQVVLNVAGVSRAQADSKGLVKGEVLNGGDITLGAQTGYLVTEAGSVIDVSGAAPVRLDIPNAAGGLGMWVGSDAGSISLGAQEGALLDGALVAHAGGASNRGGSFNLRLGYSDAPLVGGYPTVERVVSLAQSVSPLTPGLSAGVAIPDARNGLARLGAETLEAAGFDSIRLRSRDVIRLENGLNLGGGRALALKEVKLDSPRIETAGGDASLQAETLRLGNYDAERQEVVNAPAAGTGVLRASASLLELAGKFSLSGMQQVELSSTEEIRLAGISTSTTPRPTSLLRSAADLVLHAAVVAPTTYSNVGIQAPGRTVTFSSDTVLPALPLSAAGSLKVEAGDIVQGGNIWAPFGQIDLQATNSVTFLDGSLTSAAASADALIPFGKIENGLTWVYDSNSTKFTQSEAPEKSIRISAANLDMQSGARVDLSGGGDLQAYEFTVGPGGSSDILNQAGVYAILPGYAGGFAPGDSQETAGFDRAAGDAVYLSGAAGLPAGVYTLLPAHYALLPGAWAVKVSGAAQDVSPVNSYTRADGIQVIGGYLTDNRAAVAGPRDARWSGFQVLSRAQVLDRSEMTLARASNFFAAGDTRPQDAGLLSLVTTGVSSDSLKLDALYNLAAASSGQGAAVDISALNLEITSLATGSVNDPNAVHLSTDRLNALGAASLFLGGTRSSSGDSTTLTVGAERVTLANDAAHALQGAEIILAARDTLTLKAGSAIEALGAAGDTGSYTTAGNGALLRAATSTASFARSGSPDGSLGTLVSESSTDAAGNTLTATVGASNSITLDATKQNAFQGMTQFADAGQPVAGNLALGGERVSFGAAPTSTTGLVFSQTELDGLSSLASLALTSYSTFDLYGDVNVGGVDAQGKPSMNSLSLLGAGLAGLDNAGKTAHLRASEMLIANPAGVAFNAGGALGSGTLDIQADRLVLGEGEKSIQGYATVNVTANELVGRGKGGTQIAAATNLNLARISGERGADQTLAASGQLSAAKITADRVLASVHALGAKWALSGTGVNFDTLASLPSGQMKLTATAGKLELGANAEVDAAGRTVVFYDVSQASPGGRVELVSDTGDVELKAGVKAGARVNVSAAAGGDAGDLVIRAANGSVILAADSLQGQSPLDAAGKRGEGARFELDVATLADFSALNVVLNQGKFDDARSVRVRTGDLSVAAGDTVKAQTIQLAADNGKLDVAGHLDVSGDAAGSIGLYAKSDVNLLAGAKVDAYAAGVDEHGGEVVIATVSGSLNLAAGSAIDVSGGVGGDGGKVLLRAPRTGGGVGSDVSVGSLGGGINGANSVVLEAFKLYSNINTLTDTGASSGTTLSLATVNADNASFAGQYGAIKTRLGKTGDANFYVRSGVEVRSPGDLTLNKDWNLAASRAGGEPGVLTLRADGNLKLNNNLSDGFNVATPLSGTAPATLLADDSWSYRLIAGADTGAADPLVVKAGAADVTLAAGKLVRTGTGDIQIASGHDIKLADAKSVIYSAGRVAEAAAGFVTPTNAQFSQGGGDVSLTALNDIVGTASAQLYSNWLFRQGSINASTSAYALQPAWWVRFDQFQQGVGALGGGNVRLHASGDVQNVSASTPTQARMKAVTPDATQLVKTGGGDVRVETGGDLLGGQYYADRGDLTLKVGGKLDSGQKVGTGVSAKPLYTILALGDAQARVRAEGDVNIHTVLNPHLVVQSSGSGSNFNIANAASANWSLFSTYGEDSAVQLDSLAGKVTLHNVTNTATSTVAAVKDAYKAPLNFSISSAKYNANLLSVLPPSLAVTAFQGDVLVDGTQVLLSPAARGDLTLLAADSIGIPTRLTMSDMDHGLIPDALRPGTTLNQFLPTTSTAHAPVPVHVGDSEPVRIYAVAGDVSGKANTLNLTLSEAVRVRAGRDVLNLGIQAQHANADDVSLIEAGRDIRFTQSGTGRNDNARIWVGGQGRLEVTAGRDIDLGSTAGIVSRGDLDNAALAAEGVDIQVAAGVGAKGIDYAAAVSRLVAALGQAGADADDALLWQARWLTGDASLDAANALVAVKAVEMLNAESQRTSVRDWLFTALRATGRDSTNPDSPYAANYARGYAALELLFPGIGQTGPDGAFKNYQGGVNLFASRIKSERGGDIEVIVPGGELVVGLANTPASLVAVGNQVLGMVTVEEGDIRVFTRDDMRVNQSRILTVGGGDILLWSSEGDIDAGKGKKTASAVPPPVIKVDSQGNVTQELQGAATGSGIGALSGQPGVVAGDVDLIASKGTVNAGDAGIRAGNLNIAAEFVIGGDNIQVSGTSAGVPVADTGSLSAGLAGNSSLGDTQSVQESTKSIGGQSGDSQKTADEAKQNLASFRPSFISVEVLGFGNGTDSVSDSMDEAEKLKREEDQRRRGSRQGA